MTQSDRGRWREIVGSVLGTLRRRPRLFFLGACLLVVVGSWWGTMNLADRLMSGLPDRAAPDAPLPMSEEEIQAQIKEAKALNERLRAQRQERAFELGQARAMAGDSSAPEFGPLAAGGDAGHPGGDLPGPADYVPTDTAAEPVHTVRPEYPDLARQAGAEGTVVVQALVDARGHVVDTRVLRSIPLLDDAAQDAVRRWSFRPAQADGHPVATWISVPITFRR